MKQYEFVGYRKEVNYPDGIYNALYNGEPSVIRIKGGEPVWVQFIDRNAIYDKRGILLSSVELLLPAQQLQL